MSKFGKVKLPHRKHTADMAEVRIATPAVVVLPMSQHIGAPAVPIVKVNDKVCVGTKVAEAGGKVSTTIHSPVSGTVKKIGDYLLANGKNCQAITIESDGEMTMDPSITPPVVNTPEELCQAIRESGLVGLGGAGFPTANKLESAFSNKIDTIIINAAECEPYITADNRTMIDNTDNVVRGVKIVQEYIPGHERVIIAIENNKPAAIKKLTDAFAADPKVKVVGLPAEYPQGAEKTLIHTVLGRIVPDGKLPFDVGCVMLNVTSVAFIAEYLKTGIPLTWRTITVDGSAVKSPKNVLAPIGTSLRDVLAFCDTDFDNLGKVIYGGPMMGVAVYDLDAPTEKTTNAILAFTIEDSLPKKQYACIHCGKCIAHCPMALDPHAIGKALKIESKDERAEKLQSENVLSCIECGSCSYICPSRRPLVENPKLAKLDLRRALAEKKN